ncbi:MAG: PQQ-binding-like beta-propeller repeat protein [Rhodovibrionaceae bacterium]
MAILLRGLALTLFCLAIAGCSTVEDLFKEDEELLPGERIAILSLERGLEADPAIADLRVTLPPAQPNSEWPTAGGNNAHALGHVALSGGLQRAWTAGVGESSDDSGKILTQPVVANGRVFTMDSRAQVSAFDAGSGGAIWRNDLQPEDEDDGFFGGGLAVANGRIYVTTGFAKVFALDAGSGGVIWEASVPAPMRAAPTVADGRVFAITLDNAVYAFNAEDGAPLWQHIGFQELAGLIGAASPAVSGSTVIAPYSSGEIFALLAENGRELWSDNLATRNRTDQASDLADIRALPVIDGNRVFAISHSGRMAAIDMRRGLRAWDIGLGGKEMPWLAGDFLFVITKDAQLVAVTRDQGRIRWVTNLDRWEDPEDREGPIAWTGPVLAGDRLVVASSTGVALTLSPYDGEVLGATELPGSVSVPPVVANGILYFVTDGGDLVALR